MHVDLQVPTDHWILSVYLHVHIQTLLKLAQGICSPQAPSTVSGEEADDSNGQLGAENKV